MNVQLKQYRNKNLCYGINVFKKRYTGIGCKNNNDVYSVEKSPGIDGIRIGDLQLIVHKISLGIAKLINLCTKTGIIPDMLKWGPHFYFKL